MEKKIPEAVQEEAERHGIYVLKYIGLINGAEAYTEQGEIGEDGMPLAMGLPCVILYKNESVIYYNGIEALSLPDPTEP